MNFNVGRELVLIYSPAWSPIPYTLTSSQNCSSSQIPIHPEEGEPFPGYGWPLM